MYINCLFYSCLICASMILVGLNKSWSTFTDIKQNSKSTINQVNKQGKAPEVTRYYVAKSGDGSDGSSWEKAFQQLQAALFVATLYGGGEIWVAKGVYYPVVSLNPDNARESTFLLSNNISLYGGFDTDDTKFSDRDWEKNVTVLSGDIDGNDITNEEGIVTNTDNIHGQNAYTVVSVANGNITGIIDGFTITAGYSNGISDSNDIGGGFYCAGYWSNNECSPFLNNIIFSGNYAKNGGGAMYNDGRGGNSSPNLTNVIFSGNRSDYSGGAMYNMGDRGCTSPTECWDGRSNPVLTNVIFYGNSAEQFGGALHNNAMNGNSSPILTNVIFSGNSAQAGGAMSNVGMHGNNPRMVNVTFSGNSAGHYGGAIYNYISGTSNPVLENSILWNNQDSSGIGTISSSIYNEEIIINEDLTVTLKNCILQNSISGGVWIGGTYIDGGGNLDTNPKFIKTVDPTTAPTTTGNLRLKSSSPAIDVGDNKFVIGVTTDLDGSGRIIDGDGDGEATVDMGAYEYQIPYIYDISLPLAIR